MADKELKIDYEFKRLCSNRSFRDYVLLEKEPECRLEAVVKEKSFAGGQLRIVFELECGQQITASRYGIDYQIEAGEKHLIGWKDEHAVEVMDNGI